VLHHYSEFNKLHGSLLKRYPRPVTAAFPRFPKKHFFHKPDNGAVPTPDPSPLRLFSSAVPYFAPARQVIQERRVGLSQFIEAIVDHDSLCSDPEVCAFFEIDVLSHRDDEGLPGNWIAALQPTPPNKRESRVLSSAEKLKEHRRESNTPGSQRLSAGSPLRDHFHFGGIKYEVDERDQMPVLKTPKSTARWHAAIDGPADPFESSPTTTGGSNSFDQPFMQQY
jgi:hypothetical protein